MHTTIAAARKDFAELVNKTAYGKEVTVLTRRGKNLAALIPMEDLTLLQAIKEMPDLQRAQAALDEPGESIPLEEVRARLQRLIEK